MRGLGCREKCDELLELFARVADSDQFEIRWRLGVDVGGCERISHKEVPIAINNETAPRASANLAPDCLEGSTAGKARSRVSQKPQERTAANPRMRRARNQNGVAGRAQPKMRFGRMPSTIA